MTITNNTSVRLWFEAELKKMGVKYIKSVTNFVSVGVKNQNEIVSFFESSHVMIKNLRSMGIENFVRITIGSQTDMEYVISLIIKKRHLFLNDN